MMHDDMMMRLNQTNNSFNTMTTRKLQASGPLLTTDDLLITVVNNKQKE